MDLYKKNLSFLIDKNITLYNELNDFNIVDNYVESKAENGSFTFVYTKNGKKINCLSAYNPEDEAAKIIRKNYNKDISLFLAFGLGGGYYIRLLLKELQDNQKAVVILPDLNMFAWQLKHIDLQNILQDEKLKIIFFKNKEQIEAQLKILYWFFGSVSLLSLLFYKNHFSEKWNMFNKIITVCNNERKTALSKFKEKSLLLLKEADNDNLKFVKKIEQNIHKGEYDDIEFAYYFTLSLMQL